MYLVAGSNIFGQWLSDNIFFDNFRIINECELPIHSKLTCISWSYNVFQTDNRIFISGEYNAKGKLKEVPIPEKLNKSRILSFGNDYNLILIGNNLKEIFVFDLKTGVCKGVRCVDVDNTKMKSSIEKVIMTNDSCIYLTTAGDIFSGALPMHLDTSACLGKVVDVALGYEHKILLTDEGVVYTWGNGRRLQLGHGNLNNLDIPTVVTALSGVKIIKISAGGWHSCALSDIGDLYVWGWNDTGQLGVKLTTIDKGEQSFGIPVLVDLFCENGEEVHTHIKDVACGSRHTTILLEDGTLWTSGSNKYGQLGFSAETFEKVNHFKKAYQCCKSCTLLSGFWNTVIDTNSCRCSHWCGYDNVKEML